MINKNLKKIGLLFAGISLILLPVKAAVPSEYIANYEIKEAYEGALDLLGTINANSKIGERIPQTKFSELSNYFTVLFKKLPQDYSFKVVYQQCDLITKGLVAYTSIDYPTKLSSFMTSCYKPFTDILKKINSNYMIVPKSKASPTSGPAPLSVTFDARGSQDPSEETLPSKNFYWYYRDVDGQDKPIGVGPVVNYTFQEAGNYLVHLTVKSSNKVKGILDGEQTLSIDVAPKSAIITLYANGQRMKKENKIKIGTQEAEKGIVFDASATIAMGGRKILSHQWDITSKEGFKFQKIGDGNPDMVRVQLPGRGEYKVSMATKDNENNTVKEEYDLIASDPIAIIKQSPEKGNTSSTFTFDGSPSYSILSNLKLYTWEIFDQNGNKLETYQGKDIKQNFKEPGFYTIKLTIEDELGQTNIDTLQVYVESTDPIPQFTIQPTNEWLYPSRFNFDATISSDIDKTNGVDELGYEWIFPEDAKTRIIQSEENNGKIIVEFNATGKFKIKLMAKDKYGKMGEIEKDIEIKSILRPEIFVAPIATVRGENVNFVVKSNLPILNYGWDFADANKRSLQTDKITHVFKKTGIYKVKLSVNGENESYNEISKTVFVGERNYPIGGYEVTNKNGITIVQNEVCTSKEIDGTTIDYPAYQIDRYADFTIDPTISVNSKGEKNDLEFYFQPKNKQIYKQPNFRYKFDELGCQYIELTAEDTSIGKNNTIKVYFKVVNALPKLDNIVLFFPQYGNEIGVGFNENQVKDIFNTTYDPLIVKVNATNTIDEDGFISYFKWYYYLKADPTNVIETKITPGDIPYAFFSLPKIPGEYMFGVTMYDNDEGKNTSQNIIGNGPIVFFPPDSSKPDIPLVTLKVSQTSAEIGDEITFDVISKIISDRPDFVKERTIYYDFDGDGEWDLITKKDRVTYAYNKPSEVSGYKPRVSVLYRGYRGFSNSPSIIIKNGLKPKLLYTTWGKIGLFRDISFGDIEKKQICFDAKNCTEDVVATQGELFTYTYPTVDKYFVSMDIADKYANEAKKRMAITIEEPKNNEELHMLSIPEASEVEGETSIYVGNNLNNSIAYYLAYQGSGECYMDIDLTVDSNGDNVLENDADIACNTIGFAQYEPRYENGKSRIYYTTKDTGKLVSKDIEIMFLDFEVQLDPENKKVYDQLNQLLATMNTGQWMTGINKSYKNMIADLRNGLLDSVTTMSNVVTVKDFMEKNEIVLTKEQDDLLKSVFLALQNRSIAAAEGEGEYGIAKAEILGILPTALSIDIDQLFREFENVLGDKDLELSQQDKRKELLQKIVDTLRSHVAPEGKEAGNNQIEKVDMDDIIMPKICTIMRIYTIPSSYCNTTDTKAVPEDIVTEKGTTGGNILKIVFIIVGGLILIFVVLVVVFALRAKMNQEKEEVQTPPVA